MGPIWGQQDPGGSHVGSMNFAIWVLLHAELLRSEIYISFFLWFLHTELVKFVEILHREQEINLSNIFRIQDLKAWSIPWLHPQVWAYEVWVLCQLYHLPLDKMATISEMIFSEAFSWMKSFVFWLKNTLKFFPKGTLLAITQHWFR